LFFYHTRHRRRAAMSPVSARSAHRHAFRVGGYDVSSRKGIGLGHGISARVTGSRVRPYRNCLAGESSRSPYRRRSGFVSFCILSCVTSGVFIFFSDFVTYVKECLRSDWVSRKFPESLDRAVIRVCVFSGGYLSVFLNLNLVTFFLFLK